MISLPLTDGIYIRSCINKYRAKNNIPEPEEVKAIYNKQETFLEEELKLITELRVTKELFPYLDYFPNLSTINITGSGKLSGEEINNIINMYPNMKKLTIEHQDNLQFLDLSSTSKIQELQLISNKRLKKVVGIDKMNDLYEFTFYNNQTFGETQRKDLVKQVYRISNDLSAECNLDVLYMPEFINYLNQNNLSLDDVKDYIVWSEHLKSGIETKLDHLEYKTPELYSAYKKAKNVVDLYIKETDTPKQKYAILNEWMCENIKYDFNGLNTNRTHSENGALKGRYGGINGTVNAFMYNSCVCQGYSKAMQMLLMIDGINSTDIGCVASTKERTKKMISFDNQIHSDESDHSIIKVNLDGKIYYSDITWDAGRVQSKRNRHYFLLSKADISKDHRLLGEKNTIDAGKSVSSEEQEELLNFAINRIKEVNEKQQSNTSKNFNETTKENIDEHKKVISRIEKLLNVTIDDISKRENGNINKSLDDLYYNGELEYKDWQSMKKEIRVEPTKIKNQQTIKTSEGTNSPEEKTAKRVILTPDLNKIIQEDELNASKEAEKISTNSQKRK